MQMNEPFPRLPYMDESSSTFQLNSKPVYLLIDIFNYFVKSIEAISCGFKSNFSEAKYCLFMVALRINSIIV